MIDKIMVRPAVAGLLLHEWINFKAMLRQDVYPEKWSESEVYPVYFVSRGRGYFNHVFLDQFKKK